MKQPFTGYLKSLLLALALGTGYTSWGQTYTPITLTGFNQDVIAEGTGAAPNLTTYDVDGSNGAGYVFMSANYVNPTGTAPTVTRPIPNNGLITSISTATAGLTFQLGGYAANNVLRVPATGNTGGGTGTGADAGTITFATPSPASTVYALVTGGGGAIVGGVAVTITFSDGTTQVFTGQSISDWFTPNGATVAYQGFGRLARTVASGIDNASSTTPNLYQLSFALAASNVTKPIASITFGKTTTATGVIDVFAITTAAVPVCSAMPTNLSATATTTSGGSTALTTACSSTSIYLSATGIPANTAGYTYQWQSSTTSATTGFANITGATSSTYTATGQTAATYYRLVVTCLYDGTAGGTGVPSTAVQVAQSPVTNCYCIPAAHTSTGTLYTSVTTVTLPGDAGVTLTNSPGLLATPYYAAYPASTTTTSLGVNGSYTLTVAAIANQRVSAWIDYDQNGTFDANEFYILRTSGGAVYATTATNLTATILPPANALPGSTRMRIRSDYFSNTVLNTYTGACSTTMYGEVLDYSVSITSAACAGTPPALTVSATAASVCAGTSFTLSASLPTAGSTGFTYQWQSSPTGANTFTNLGTAQAVSTYAVATQAAATDYQLLLTCTTSGLTSTSNVVTVAQNPLYYCYCTPVTSGGASDGITNVTLGPLNNTSSTTNAAPYYTDYTALQLANTLPTPVLTLGGTATVSVKMGTDANQYSGVWIDFDHSGTFDTGEFFTLATNAGGSGTSVIPVTIPGTALTGLTKMRVRGGNDVVLLNTQSCTAASSTSNYGEVEDYFVNIAPATACAGTLPATTATTTVSAACTATPAFTLGVTGLAAGITGVTYQWQSSPAGANTFTNLGSVQTTPGYAVTSQTATLDYRVVVTCTASGSTSTSSPVTVTQQATCYCAPVSTGSGEYIESVTLPGFNGFTNASYINSPGGYGDYTAAPGLTTTVAQGATYTNGVSLTIRVNNGGSQGGMWIDYDHSGTFDASEYLLIGTSSATGTDVTLTANLSIPATALLGQTRVRVRWRNSAFAATDACTSGLTTWYGETEDYLITIAAPCTASTATFSYGGAPFCISGTTNPTLTLATGATAGTFSSTTGLTINATTGAITLSSSTPGTYTVTNTVAATVAQCASTATTSVTINAAPTAGFSYPATTICAGTATTRTPTLATGATAGTYSLPTATGLSVNATTGVVTIGATATAGTYTVTNTVAASGGCAAVTSTATLTISAPTTATFSYPAGPYCTSGTANPAPTITGTAGGTFSSTTGLTINATTGAITLSSSTAGTYTVTYTVAGTCGSSSTQTITINTPATAGFSFPTTAVCAGSAATITPTLATGATAGTFTLPTATGLSINGTTGAVTVGATAAAGTYTVTNTVASGGCAAVTSTATFTLTAPTTATFSYSGSPFCASGTNPTPTITGTAGGAFSSTTGLTINGTTGAITLSGSTPGTYTVTYTVAGTCGSSSTQSVTINAAPTAGFSYPTTTICAGTATTRTPTLATGATAGTYSLPTATGLSVNATTGVVTIGATAVAGTYTVTNTVAASGGCAAVISTATFTISAAPTTPTLTTSGTPATGILLTSSAATGNQFYLNGVVIPSATGQTYLINSGTKNGSYTVTVTNAAGCSATSAAVNVTVTAATPGAAAASLTVYPNPTRDGLLTLELSGYREAVQVSVVNALGQRVYETTLSGTALTQHQTLNLSHLATGVYLLQARTASGSVEQRRIVRE
jgi:hypothetical protein